MGHAHAHELAHKPGTDVDARGPLLGGCARAGQVLFDVRSHLGRHLIGLTCRRRPEQHLDTLRGCAKRHHLLDGAAHNAVARSHTARVGCGDHTCAVVGQQHGGAVRNQHAQREVFLASHDRVSGRNRLIRGPVDHGDGVGVELFHPHETLGGKAQDVGETLTVRGDVGWVVANMRSQVERIVRRTRNPASTGSKHHADGAVGKIWHASQSN